MRSRHRRWRSWGLGGYPSTSILAGAIRLNSQNMYMFALLAHLYKTYFISLRYSRGNNPVTRWNCFAKLSGRSYPTACAISAMLNSVPILKEIGYIRESLKMRNLHSSMWDKVCHPMQNAENFFVPLLYRSEKISEELSAASICKGLSTKRKRTCCTKVKLRVTDSIYLLCVALLAAGLAFINYHVILL